MASWRRPTTFMSDVTVRKLEPHITFALLSFTAAIPLVALKLLLPLLLVLPVLSLALTVGAGLVALCAWYAASECDRDRIGLWDVSGAFALIGFAAGVLSEPEHVLELLGSWGSSDPG